MATFICLGVTSPLGGRSTRADAFGGVDTSLGVEQVVRVVHADLHPERDDERRPVHATR